jgi:hypothetical protein
MEQNRSHRPEASTDERASSLNPAAPPAGRPPEDDDADWPDFATHGETHAFWAGVTHGIRSVGRDAAHPHMPADFPLQLARDGAAPGLTSAAPLETWPYDPADQEMLGQTSHGPVPPPPPHGRPRRADREDGLTVAVEQHFLRTLAETGVVADACRAARISRQAVYARRNSAAGRPFALAWDAAVLLARRAIADDVLSRARHGVIERVYRDGKLVAERHKLDNRLTMAVLSRLDRQAEGIGANAPAVNAVADEFEQFLGLLGKGLDAAADFVENRCRAPAPGAAPIAEEGEAALLARLADFEYLGAGLSEEIETGDLDPAEMESWTEAQADRAEASGLLEQLPDDAWPASALDPTADGTDGMCQARQLYLGVHGEADAAEDDGTQDDGTDDFAGCMVWEDDDLGWATDFPPPEGFTGYEEGDPGEDGYRRELAPEERAVMDAELAAEKEDEDAARAMLRARREAARRRFFELDSAPGSDVGDAGAANGCC